MRTPAMIPSRDWSQTVTSTFNEAAGLSEPDFPQKILCLKCVKSGNSEPPTAIVMVEGTSLCSLHV